MIRRGGARNEKTLQDVADAAGVSRSTASRALAGKAARYRISSATNDRVHAAAKRLGFRPSHLARSLRLQRSGMVGLLVPDISNPFFASIAQQVTQALQPHGYSVLLADSGESTSQEARWVEQLLQRQIEGFIICPVGLDQTHLRNARREVPLVLADRIFPDAGYCTVSSDQAAGAASLLQLLLDAGHQHIGILQGLPQTFPNDQRLNGIRDAWDNHPCHNHRSRPPLVIAGNQFDEASGRAACQAIIDAHPETTALVALSTPIAIGAMQALQSSGRHLGQDITMVAFDDHPLIDFLATPWTTAKQDVVQLGKTAASMLLQAIEQPSRSSNPSHQSIPIQIVERPLRKARA
jgi:LacI family transcriptional regulator